MNTCPGPCSEVIRAGVDIEALESWAGRQNGTLQRLEVRVDGLGSKLDRLFYAVLGLMTSVVGGLAAWILTHPGA